MAEHHINLTLLLEILFVGSIVGTIIYQHEKPPAQVMLLCLDDARCVKYAMAPDEEIIVNRTINRIAVTSYGTVLCETHCGLSNFTELRLKRRGVRYKLPALDIETIIDLGCNCAE